MDFELLSTERLYDGHLKVFRLTISHSLINGERSTPIQREVIHRREAVAVLLLAPNSQEVVLVKQFRVGAIGHTHPWVIEPVAGLLEHGEDPIETAKREVAEETGLVASNFTHITSYFSSVGGSNEVTHLYSAHVDLTGWDSSAPRGLPSEGEDIQPIVLSIDEFYAELNRQKISCASLFMASQWLKLEQAKRNIPAV